MKAPTKMITISRYLAKGVDKVSNSTASELSRWGMFAFIAQALLSILAVVHSGILSFLFAATSISSSTSIPPMTMWIYLSLFLVFVIPPFVLTFITRHKLCKPLKGNKIGPRTRFWSRALSVFGFFYGLVIGGILLTYAHARIEKMGE